LSRTLTYFLSLQKFQFRAMLPAQIHEDDKDRHKGGGVEWFVSTDGTEVAVTRSVSLRLRTTSADRQISLPSLPVTQYKNASRADQPGGSVTMFPHTTTTHVRIYKGHLVTAKASSTAMGRFVYQKALLYRIVVSGDTPILLNKRLVDPGRKWRYRCRLWMRTTMGNLGLTGMESSNSEYLAMWRGTIDPAGKFVAAIEAAGFFFANGRIGDYSTTALDQSDDRKDVFS